MKVRRFAIVVLASALAVSLLAWGPAAAFASSKKSEARKRIAEATTRLSHANKDYEDFDDAAVYTNATIRELTSSKYKKYVPKGALTTLRTKYRKTLIHCWDASYAACVGNRSIIDLARLWRWWSRAADGTLSDGFEYDYALGTYSVLRKTLRAWSDKLRKANTYQVTFSSQRQQQYDGGYTSPISSTITIPQVTITTHDVGDSEPDGGSEGEGTVNEQLDYVGHYVNSQGDTADYQVDNPAHTHTLSASVDPHLERYPDDVASPLAPLQSVIVNPFVQAGMVSGCSYSGTEKIVTHDGQNFTGPFDGFTSPFLPWWLRFSDSPLDSPVPYIIGDSALAPWDPTWWWNAGSWQDWSRQGHTAARSSLNVVDGDTVNTDVTSLQVQFTPQR